MKDYFKICKEHGKKAKYCYEERRWICEDCEPEVMGAFVEIQGFVYQY